MRNLLPQPAKRCVKCNKLAVDQVPVIHRETGAEPWLWFCDEHGRIAMSVYETEKSF